MLMEQSILNVPKQVRDVSISEGNGFALGDTSAPVKVIMFFDYDCHFCKLFFNNTFPEIESKLINTNKIRFVFRHFPIEMHPNAYLSAVMAEHALQQGKFYDMNEKLMKTDLLNYENLVQLALELNVDTTEWYLNPVAIEKVDADKSIGEKINVRGTPTFIINNKMYTGIRNFTEFEELITLK